MMREKPREIIRAQPSNMDDLLSIKRVVDCVFMPDFYEIVNKYFSNHRHLLANGIASMHTRI